MCGRYSLTESGEEIAARFLLEGGLFAVEALLHPRYNVAPGQSVLTVAAGAQGREAAAARWGFLPVWAREARLAQINARSETAAGSRMFGRAVRARRCVVPASSFFEWRREGGARLPLRFAPAAGGLWGLAGIWEDWPAPGGLVRTCAILTMRPNPLVAGIHDRMPVILTPEAEAAWLDPGAPDPGAQIAGWAPYPADAMLAHRVSPIVNSARNDGPECIAAVE